MALELDAFLGCGHVAFFVELFTGALSNSAPASHGSALGIPGGNFYNM
jgi:hypothetical protein